MGASKKKKPETVAEHLHRTRRATRQHVTSCDVCWRHRLRNKTKAPGCK